MATDKQIAANRANAQKSSGPRTEEGKAASSRNNLRHGLTLRGFIVLDGQEGAFAQLEADLRTQLVPQGPLQEIVFKRALESAWNLERCRQAAVTLHERIRSLGIDPLLDLNNADRYSNIQRYSRENESSFYKALRELGKLQADKSPRQQTAAQPQSTPAEPEGVSSSPIQVEAKDNGVQTDAKLKGLAKIHPFEANSTQPAVATRPLPDVIRDEAA